MTTSPRQASDPQRSTADGAGTSAAPTAPTPTAAKEERGATADDGALEVEKLSSFRHALNLLTCATKLAAENREAGTRVILEPVFDRLGEAIAATRHAASTDPAAFERLQRDFDAGREKLRSVLPPAPECESGGGGDGPGLAQGGGSAGVESQARATAVGGGSSEKTGGGGSTEGGGADVTLRQGEPSGQSVTCFSIYVYVLVLP